MISLDKLKSIRHVITHASCPDGVASALIIKDALSDVRVSFMSYGTAELAALPAEPGMLFVDFSPPRDRVQEFVAAGALCLDHHPTARDIVEAFGENGVFGENERSESGAWLAYEQVWKPLWLDAHGTGEGVFSNIDCVRKFAELAAIRDTWKRDDPRWREACEQAAELLFWPVENVVLRDFLPGGRMGAVGPVLFEKQLAAACKSLDESHQFRTSKGTRVCMFQGVSTTSDAAEIDEQQHVMLGRGERYPTELVVGFHYRVDAGKLQLQFSMRSHTGYDVSAFAKAHGGGGHKAAAGFTVEVSPETGANPYRVFQLLLEAYEDD